MRELLVCLTIFAIAVWGFFHFYPDEPNPAPGLSEQAKPPRKFERNVARRDVTPNSVLPAPRVTEEQLERLPAIEPPPPPPRPPEPDVWDNPIVLAAGTIKSGDTTIYLKDIDPLPLDHKCKGQENREWPCGMFARTDMRQFVRNRTLSCEPGTKHETEGTGTKKQREIRTRCTLGNYDMSAWLVLTGWATPKGNLFQEELEEAKQKQRGQWRPDAP